MNTPHPPIPLLPCPFCGSAPKLRDMACRTPRFDVICVGKIGDANCQCHLWPVDSAAEAAAIWNTRANTSPDPSLAHLLESIVGTLDPVSQQDWHGKWRIHAAIELAQKARVLAAHGSPDRDRALSLLRSVCTPLDHNLEIQPGCATHRCIQAFLGGEQASESSVPAARPLWAEPGKTFYLEFSYECGSSRKDDGSAEIPDNEVKNNSYLVKKMIEASDGLEDLEDCMLAALVAIRPYLATREPVMSPVSPEKCPICSWPHSEERCPHAD